MVVVVMVAVAMEEEQEEQEEEEEEEEEWAAPTHRDLAAMYWHIIDLLRLLFILVFFFPRCASPSPSCRTLLLASTGLPPFSTALLAAALLLLLSTVFVHLLTRLFLILLHSCHFGEMGKRRRRWWGGVEGGDCMNVGKKKEARKKEREKKKQGKEKRLTNANWKQRNMRG